MNLEEKIKLPIFKYLDHTSSVIDIGGFTRITENSINQVIQLFGLKIVDYFTKKEFSKENITFACYEKTHPKIISTMIEILVILEKDYRIGLGGRLYE